MAKIFVHIGLPKTATTTLQTDLFPNIVSDNLIYLGIRQPRNGMEQDIVYKKFMTAVNCGERINEVKIDIKNYLDKNISLIVSEEMIVVREWKTKVQNLERIINEFDYEIILTVRSPEKAILSYYIELYEREFKDLRANFNDLALRHEYFKIYHYKYFLDFLESIFPEKRIHIYKFEDIVKNNIGNLIYLFGETKTDIKLQIHNSKLKHGNNIIKKEQLSVFIYVSNFIEKLWIKNFLREIISPKIYNYLKYRFIITINKKVKLSNDITKEDLDKLRYQLTEDISFLKSKYNIDYN